VVPQRDFEALTGLFFISDLESGLYKPSFVTTCICFMLSSGFGL
jgi:hypothetical protein